MPLKKYLNWDNDPSLNYFKKKFPNIEAWQISTVEKKTTKRLTAFASLSQEVSTRDLSKRIIIKISLFFTNFKKNETFHTHEFLFRPNICMITFQNQNEFKSKNISLEENTASTLLIPKAMLEDFRLKTKKFNGNNALYLQSLLRRFRTVTHSGMIPEPEKLKTSYQERNLNLQKVSFKPKNKDWIELGELALAFGKSRCWLFVFLLKLDLVDMWHYLVEAGLKKIVPMIPRLELEVFQRLERISHNFIRGYHIKV